MSEKAKWNIVFGVVGYLDDFEVKGEPARRASVETIKGGRVRCTLWPQFNSIKVSVGDFISVQGPVEEYHYEKDGTPRTNYNMSVKRIAVFPNQAPAYDGPKKFNPSENEAF